MPDNAITILEDDSAKPTGKSVRSVQIMQLAIRLDERFLCCILGQVKIAQDRVGIPVCHVLESLYDPPKGLQIAGTSANDQ